jgi:two-component system LytT family response regulator
LRLLIVDDERPARERLRRMLAHEPGITSVTEAADGVEALALIARRPFVPRWWRRRRWWCS